MHGEARHIQQQIRADLVGFHLLIKMRVKQQIPTQICMYDNCQSTPLTLHCKVQ